MELYSRLLRGIRFPPSPRFLGLLALFSLSEEGSGSEPRTAERSAGGTELGAVGGLRRALARRPPAARGLLPRRSNFVASMVAVVGARPAPMTMPSTPDRSARRTQLLSVGLAIAAQIIASWWFGPERIEELRNDAAVYARLGANIAAGLGFTNGGSVEVLRTPGYPAFLSVFFFLFGHRVFPVLVGHALLHGGSTYFFGRLACVLFPGSKYAARYFPFVFALYPYALHAGTRILTESLSTFFLSLALFALSQALGGVHGRARFGYVSLGAGSLVAAGVVRPSFVLLPLALGLVMFLSREVDRRLWWTFAVLVILLGSIWPIRTSLILGKPVPSGGLGSGNNLHIASFEYGDLSKGIPATTDFENEAYRESLRRVPDLVKAPPQTPAGQLERDAVLFRLGAEQIAEHPWRYLRACGIRAVKTWVPQSLDGVPRWLLSASAVASLVLLLLGGLGVWRFPPGSPSQWMAVLPAIYVTLMHSVLHTEARYSIPVRYVLLLYGGLWVERQVEAMVRRESAFARRA